MRTGKNHAMTPSSFIFMSLGLFFFGLFCFPAGASAHKITVFAGVEEDMVVTESKSGNRWIKGGKITVTDDAGIVVADGITDDQGKFSFTWQKPAELHVKLDAGHGHGAGWTVFRNEFDGVAGKALPAPRSQSRRAGDIAVGIAVISAVVGLWILFHYRKKRRSETGRENPS